MLPTKFWADMTWPDFRRADMRMSSRLATGGDRAARAPSACRGRRHDQRRLCQAPVERVPDDLPVLFLPLQQGGVSIEHSEYPGALMLTVASAIRAWTEIGDSVAHAGCRKLIVMNSHGGNVAAIEAVTMDLRVRWQMLAVNASWRRLGYPDGLFSARETAQGVHAGDAETSLMLGFRPDAVRLTAARDFSNAAESMERNLCAPSCQAAARIRLDGERSQSGRLRRRSRQGERRQGRSCSRPWGRTVHCASPRRTCIRSFSPRVGTAAAGYER